MNEVAVGFIMSIPFLVGLIAFGVTGLITRKQPNKN